MSLCKLAGGGQSESILQGRMNLFTTGGEKRAEQESFERAGDAMISTGTCSWKREGILALRRG
jgi:hypothetical protein